jgi:hypothetical protein
LVSVLHDASSSKKNFTDKWGTSFVVGDAVVASLYYQRWGHSESSYVLSKDSHVVYMHVCLVRVLKFLMPPKDHKVSENDDVYEYEILRLALYQ